MIPRERTAFAYRLPSGQSYFCSHLALETRLNALARVPSSENKPAQTRPRSLTERVLADLANLAADCEPRRAAVSLAGRLTCFLPEANTCGPNGLPERFAPFHCPFCFVLDDVDCFLVIKTDAVFFFFWSY